MIIISRLAGEAVVVGDELTVTIVRVEGDQVILHIEGPDGVAVERGEVLAASPLSAGNYGAGE